MDSEKSHIARLEARFDDLQKSIDQQRNEGKERGNKIEDMKKELASQNVRISEMERHVHNECVWGNGQITDIKEDIATLNANYSTINDSVKLLAQSVDKMKTYVIWMIAGSVIGGGAANSVSNIFLKVLGGQ